MNGRHTPAGSHIGVGIAAFGVASIMGVLQGLSIADIDFPLRSESLYYLAVTAHGVLMALVFPIFFIMGLGYVFAQESLGRITGRGIAWAGFLGRGGRLGDGRHHHPARAEHGALHVLSADAGTSALLHRRDAAGRRLLDLGRRDDCQLPLVAARAPGVPVPLSMHGMLATVIIWYLATSGLAIEVVGMLIPWSLGLVDKIDPDAGAHLLLVVRPPARLLPAAAGVRVLVLRAAAGRRRAALQRSARPHGVHLFVVLSTPVGFHHQFTDPGISAGWKLAHTVTTYAVVYPSFVTAFTVIASLEVAGRMKGARGLFNWIGRLPWADPFFSSVALAMIAFVFGGFGGVINAAYAMNAMVHNTAWIQGHFHVTLGTTVALTFMGATYWLLPRLTGRALRFPWLARIQPYLWFGGMVFFSTSYHIAGLRGMPRRVYSGALSGADGAAWQSLTMVAAVGGVILFVSALAFLTVVVATWLAGRRIEPPAFEFAVPLEPVTTTGVWDRFGLWTMVAVVLVAIAYVYPLFTLLTHPRYGSPPFQPF